MKRHTHHVLLVDDNLDERFLSHRALKKVLTAGSSVFLASSGNEAIAYLMGEGEFAERAKFPFPTIVITDLNMAEGDGFDVLELLDNNRDWSVVPRILFTSSTDDDDVRIAFTLGVSAYHVKPTAPADTEQCLRGIIEYWTGSHVPPVDENGRLLLAVHAGSRRGRIPSHPTPEKMKRPDHPPGD